MEIDFNISKLSLEGLGLLDNIAGLTDVPDGAFNIRANGVSVGRAVTKAVNTSTVESNRAIHFFIVCEFLSWFSIPTICGIAV